MQPRWITISLYAAGLYNLAWGALVVLFPRAPFDWAELEPPIYPQIWQCLGMVVGLYGIGYLIAARDAARHWPVVFVGLLGKVLGPIGMAWYVLRGDLPPVAGLVCVFNDLIWWVPFVGALYYAARTNSSSTVDSESSPGDPLQDLRSQRGRTLAEASTEKPVLVTFLRHSGCTFCREALADLEKLRPNLEGDGLQLALVHMTDNDDAGAFFARYKLDDVDRYSDPDRRLYRALDLRRGKFSQLLGPRIWGRGFLAAIVARHGFGRIQGDGFQMPGVFVIDHGRVVAAFRHATAADRPDYVAIAKSAETCSV